MKIEIENPNGISSESEEFLSSKEVENFINSENSFLNNFENKPILAVARAGTNNYGLWGYMCILENNKYKVIGCTLEPTKNIPEKGYIPSGVYSYKKWDSTKLKKTLRLYSVPNFTNVLVHVGNVKNDSRGCVLAARSVDNAQNPTRLSATSREMCNYLYDNYPSGKIMIGWI